MIGNTRLHCWRHAQGLVNSAEVVVHVMECNRVLQILDFLGKGVGQARESAHRHAHGEVLALNVARGDVLEIGVPVDESPCVLPCRSRDCSELTGLPAQRRKSFEVARSRFPFRKRALSRQDTLYGRPL